MNGQTDIQYHGREGDQADYHQNGPRPLYGNDFTGWLQDSSY